MYPLKLDSSLDICPGVGLLDHMVVLLLNVLGTLHAVFHSDYANFHSYQQCRRVSFSPQSLQTLLLIDFLAVDVLTGARRCFAVVLICISVTTSTVEHICMCLLLATCVSSLEKLEPYFLQLLGAQDPLRHLFPPTRLSVLMVRRQIGAVQESVRSVSLIFPPLLQLSPLPPDQPPAAEEKLVRRLCILSVCVRRCYVTCSFSSLRYTTRVPLMSPREFPFLILEPRTAHVLRGAACGPACGLSRQRP